MKRALTTSEINGMLIAKGYDTMRTIHNIPANKWGGNAICFSEHRDGYSTVGIYKFTPYEDIPGSGHLKCLVSYSKLKAADKKEFQALIESLSNK